MPRITQTGIDWDSVVADLESQDWEEDPDNPGSQRRSSYLGSVFAIYPSGKYYTPWATSNLDPCPVCGGSGQVKLHQSSRKRGKAKKRLRDHTRKLVRMRQGCARRALHVTAIIAQPRNREANYMRSMRGWKCSIARLMDIARGSVSCARCAGCGSAEAADDEAFRELMEQEANDRHLSIESGEGDPCDIFACQYRDTPDDDDDDDDQDSED